MNLGSGIKMSPEGYVGAMTPGNMHRRSDKPIRVSAPTRRCACGARLSQYNHDPVCAPCSGERWASHG